MAILDRASILANVKLKEETVSVPEWGGEVVLREPMADEADAFEQKLAATRNANGNGNGHNDPFTFRANIVALCAIDENGKRMFSPEDVAQLGKLSRIAMDRLSAVASRLAGYSEDAKKNSPAEDSFISDLH